VSSREKGATRFDNLDTPYKRELLKVISDAFQWDTAVPAGTLNLIKANGETVECALILMSEWQAKLPDHRNDLRLSVQFFAWKTKRNHAFLGGLSGGCKLAEHQHLLEKKRFFS
jgi:hypothetical protein